MKFEEVENRAVEIRRLYNKFEKKEIGRKWGKEQIMLGLVGDIGDLSKLVMAKNNWRKVNNADEKIKHELADCLWSLLVLANEYDIDLEKSFLKTMNELEKRLK